MMTTSTLTAPRDAASGLADASAVIQLIETEYEEMPGLALTPRQAARLWGLNGAQSERLLSQLAERGFLIRDSRGNYRRRNCPRCS